MAGIWEAPKPDLSQGDLLSPILVGTASPPRTALKRGPTRKGGGENWETSPWKPAPGSGLGEFLARGYNATVIVVTESCELDKQGGSVPVSVAPIFPITLVHDGEPRQAVREHRRFPFFPIPEVPGLIPESYADLRMITYINRALIDEATRHHSLTAEGLEALHAQLVAFHTRISLSELKGKPPGP